MSYPQTYKSLLDELKANGIISPQWHSDGFDWHERTTRPRQPPFPITPMARLSALMHLNLRWASRVSAGIASAMP